MNFVQIVLVSLLSQVVSAHFRVPFPGERNATNWGTQTESPCGGDNMAVLPRFEWNPKGSPIEINYHHTFGVGAIYFCGSGNCTTGADFNELIYEPIDQTTGNFCIPSVELPAKYNTVNQTGVIQIVYVANNKQNNGYEYMYNCVDVVVSEDGPLFDNQCSNSTGVDAQWDKGVAELEKASTQQLNQFSSFTYLLENRPSSSIASAKPSSTGMGGMDMGGMDMGGMDMGGMDMSGMDMGGMSMTSSGAKPSVTKSATTSDDMGGMDMGGMNMSGMSMDGMTTTDSMTMETSTTATANSTVCPIPTKVSSAGASSLSFSKLMLIALALL